MRILCLCALIAAAANTCSADDSDCPWLNTETATGLAGGSVTLSMIHAPDSKACVRCSFVRQGKDFTFTIQIETATITAASGFPSYLAECTTGFEPLRGIGNEAVACKSASAAYPQAANSHLATVIGRVRNQAFIIRASSHGTVDTEKQLREKSRAAAEQVAGNLF